ncbi:MAG: GTPase [Candidatus Woesearchaeota archaeon]
MNTKYERLVRELIYQSNLVLFVLDARFPNLTYSKKWHDFVKKLNKKIIFVINKVDLISKERESELENELNNLLQEDFIFFSAKKYWNVLKLKELAKEKVNDEILACVLGYSNVGKSSVIDALKGKASAKISSVAGFTRGVQKLKIEPNFYIFDAPGIDLEIEDETTLALLGARNPEQLQDPLTPAEIVLKNYNVSLEDYAIALNFLKKNKELDLIRASRDVLKRHFEGTLEKIIERIKLKN